MSKSTMYQLARAHTSVFNENIKMLSLFKYRVKSNTDKSKSYTVQKDPSNNKWICDCPGFHFNQHCSHITTLRIYRRSQPKNE